MKVSEFYDLYKQDPLEGGRILRSLPPEHTLLGNPAYRTPPPSPPVRSPGWYLIEGCSIKSIINYIHPSTGDTLLCYFSRLGHHHAVQELLYFGASHFTHDALGYTPLILAIIGGHQTIVYEFVARGLVPKDNQGFRFGSQDSVNIVWIACTYNDPKVVGLILGNLLNRPIGVTGRDFISYLGWCVETLSSHGIEYVLSTRERTEYSASSHSSSNSKRELIQNAFSKIVYKAASAHAGNNYRILTRCSECIKVLMRYGVSFSVYLNESPSGGYFGKFALSHLWNYSFSPEEKRLFAGYFLSRPADHIALVNPQIYESMLIFCEKMDWIDYFEAVVGIVRDHFEEGGEPAAREDGETHLGEGRKAYRRKPKRMRTKRFNSSGWKIDEFVRTSDVCRLFAKLISNATSSGDARYLQILMNAYVGGSLGYPLEKCFDLSITGGDSTSPTGNGELSVNTFVKLATTPPAAISRDLFPVTSPLIVGLKSQSVAGWFENYYANISLFDLLYQRLHTSELIEDLRMSFEQ